MSLPKGLAQHTTDDPAAAARPEGMVRPKVMRRPAHFSAPQSQPSMPTIHLPPTERAPETENENLALNSPPLALMQTAPTKLWQDDLRFGVAMLSIVVLVNLALIAWLPHLRRVETVALPAHVEMVHTAPAVPAAAPEPLTMYAKPPQAQISAAGDADVPAEAPTEPEHILHSGADSGPNQ